MDIKIRFIKSRFCPSPTGLLHLGNVRTALFNALFALKGGSLLLRIEDTDLARSKTEFIDAIVEDLLWLNLKWDEGIPNPNEGDYKNSEYLQSNRGLIYEKYINKLTELRYAYPCFCSDDELILSRKIQLSSGKAPKYNGKCRNLSEAEKQKKIELGEKSALRFKVPRDVKIEFDDLVKGRQIFSSNDLGDFVIQRKDGKVPFLFSNALDDSLMQVTHAFRGDDHLSNTPRQLLILQTLNLPFPQYGHLSTILGKDRLKLSKRNGSASIRDLRNEGFLPSAIINCLARLGHQYESNDFMDLQILAEHFSVAKLTKSPAVFDKDQLISWQKKAIQACDPEIFWNKFCKDVHTLVPESKKMKFIESMKKIILFPKDVTEFGTSLYEEVLPDKKEILKRILEVVDINFLNYLLEILQNGISDMKAIYANLNRILGIKGKQIYLPIRLALTGREDGPEIQEIIDLMGLERVQKRVRVLLD